MVMPTISATKSTAVSARKQGLPGMLITFEGSEGGGKTTQVELLEKKFQELGREIITLREPGGSEISEQIRQVVLGVKNTAMTFSAEVFLFQAQRAQTYEEIILPALAEGKVVLMDRSRDSSTIYQGVVREYGVEIIEQLNDISTQQTLPDVTILLDVPIEVGLERRRQSGKQDRLDLESMEFHQKVRDAYLDMAQKNVSQRWEIIDANQDLPTVTDLVWNAVQKHLDE